jgi:hypothetical protein
MSRSVLVVGGVVVVGAGIALAVMLAGGDGTPAGTGTTSPSGGPGTTGATGTTTGAGGTTTDLGPRPSLPGAGTPSTGGSGHVVFQTGQNPTPPTGPYGVHVTPRGERGTVPASGSPDSYSVGDVKMRDHRDTGGAPVDVPPNVHTPEGPRIDSTLTAAIGKQVRTVIQTCAKDASRDGRGAKPRVDGQIILDISGGQATIVSSVMQPHDVPEAVAATLKACIEPKLVGISSPAPNQADLASYGINVTTQLP